MEIKKNVSRCFKEKEEFADATNLLKLHLILFFLFVLDSK